MLTAATLRGVWAFVATPWDEAGRLDEDALEQDLSYLARQGFAGLYTTSSSGEVHALTLEEFCRVVNIAVQITGPFRIPLQVGCAAPDTAGFLRQAEYAAGHGVAAIQVVLPYYAPLSREEAFRFFEDVARECPNTPLVHYNTPYAKLTLEADDYRRLADRIPTLIGTKLPKGEPLWFATVCERVPELSHFTGEYTLVADVVAGARGVYSWLAVTNPRLMLSWFRHCSEGRWDEAVRIQKLVLHYKIHVKSRWRGVSPAAINKADARVNPNLRTSLRVRAPSTSCIEEDLCAARAWAAEHFPELLEL